ncbi:MAG: hypothetical protein RL653_4345, partial [Pseudomonadota bacterium]
MSNESSSTIVEEFLVKPSQVAPTLFVGLGGAGCKMVNRVYKQLKRRPDFKERYKQLSKFAYVDTNIHDLEKYREEGDDLFLISDFEKAEYSRLAGGKAYLDADDYFTQWVPQNYRFRSGDTAGAGQIRIESRLGVYYQVKHKDFVQRFRKLIEALKDHSHGHRRLDSSEIRIVLCYSVAGGTGSGSHLPMAYLLRDLAAQFGKPLVFGVAALSSVFEDKVGTNKDGVFANGYAALKETEYLMKLGAPESKFFPEDGSRVFHFNPNDRSKRTVDTKPFEVLWVIDRPESFSVKDVLDAAADALFLQMYTPIYGEQAGDFDNYTQHQRFLVPHDFEAKDIPGYTSFYGGIGAAVLHVPDESILQYCSRRGSLAVIEKSFLQGVPANETYRMLQENPKAFYEVRDIDGSDREVKETDFNRRDVISRRRLRNKLYQKRVRMLAAAEFEAGDGTDVFQQVFVHGHGGRALPEMNGAIKPVDLLNLPGAPNPAEQKLKTYAEQISGDKLNRSMAHFALNALERTEDQESGWMCRLYGEAEAETKAEFEAAVKKYAQQRSGQETKLENTIIPGIKSEKTVAKQTKRSAMEQKIAEFAAAARDGISDRLRKGSVAQPDASDWIPGAAWLENLGFLNTTRSLLEKRYAVLSVLDRVEEIVQGIEAEKKLRKEKADEAGKQAAASAAGQAAKPADNATITAADISNKTDEVKVMEMAALENALLEEYGRQMAALQQKLEAYAGVFTDLQEQFEPVREQEVAQAEKLRAEGSKDDTDRFVLDGEALQIESGRRMWDFYYVDEIADLPSLHMASNEDLSKLISSTIQRFVDLKMRGEDTPSDALATLNKEIGSTIATALRNKVVGDLRSKVDADRNGLTLHRALELEIKYRAVYLTNRKLVDDKGSEGVAELVSKTKGDRGSINVRANIHLDYLRDKLKRLIKERSDLLCYLDEKHLSQGGVRPDEVFLAAIHEDLFKGLLKDVLNESLGIQAPKPLTKDVEDRKSVVFYRAILNVPLYVFGRMRELRACYYQFKGMAKRSKVLHIDKNWEDTLPDLDPASVEEAHRQQRIRDSVLDFASLMSMPRSLIFDFYVDDARRADLGISKLVDSARDDRGAFKQDFGTCVVSREKANGRAWALRFPLEEQFVRIANGVSQGEVEQDEPIVGSYVGEAILKVQEVLAERPQMYRTFRDICTLVREGEVPRVIQSLIRVPGEWRKYGENLKARYGRNPTEEQQRTLQDIDNVQQKLTDALLQLYEVLDL